MSVNEVRVNGLSNPIDVSTGMPVLVTNSSGQDVPTIAINQGTAVETAPGLYLSSGHVFLGPLSQNNNIYTLRQVSGTRYTINPKSISNSKSKPWSRSVQGGQSISGLDTFAFDPAVALSQPTSDLASFRAAPSGQTVGVATFLAPTLKQFQTFFGTLSFSGFPGMPTSDSSQTLSPPVSVSGLSVSSVDQVLNDLAGSHAGPGTFLLSGGGAPGGTSGAGVWGLAANSKTQYVVGTVQSEYGNNNAIANYVPYALYQKIFGAYQLPAGISKTQLPHNLVIGSGNGGDQIVGSLVPQTVIDHGGANHVLAGPDGDTINLGQGSGNEIFLPANDSGTTCVVSPGTTCIVGGSAVDKLVVPLDRLWTQSSGSPNSSASDVSQTVQLLGGLYSAAAAPNGWTYSGWDTIESIAGQSGSTAPLSWEDTSYDLGVGYHLDGGNLQIGVSARDPSQANDPMVWQANVTIVGYKAGDFGLTFKPFSDPGPPDWTDPNEYYQRIYQHRLADELSLNPTPQSATSPNDDPSSAWNNGWVGPFSPVDTTALAADLKTLQAQQQAAGSVNMMVQAMATFAPQAVSDLHPSPAIAQEHPMLAGSNVH